MKMEMITNLEVQEFLKDFEKSSETIILEEGKERNELIESARKRGIIISKNDRDLGVIKTIYCFTSKANSNKVRLPKDEFIKILPQIVGRPMNNAHDRKFILGFYVDYKYIAKGEKAIAYAVFFKSAYPKLWKKAKDFQKKGHLSSSYEIWNNDKKANYLSDGTVELHEIGIAGGALIFEEYGEKPAFRGAKVLSMASKEVQECIDNKCLVYASKYKDNKVITSAGDYFTDSVKENLKKLQEEKNKVEETKEETPKVEEKKEAPKVEEKKEVKVEDKKVEVKPKVEPKTEVKKENKKEEVKPEPKVEEKKVEPTTSKIKCSNCSEEFDRIMHPDVKVEATINCPKCKAILKQDGTMVYPPQIIDFKVSCPSCGMNRWLLLERNDKEAKVRCSCKKEYKITFAEEKPKEMVDKMQFPYSGSINCPQCKKWIYYEGISGVTSRDIKCSKCKLEFSFDITKVKEHKKISRIEIIEIKKIEKSSEKGGKKTMEFMIETSKYHRYIDDYEKSVATLPGDYGESKEVAQRLTTEQRKALPDRLFAVVVRVKDKRSGKMRKIRMFPINDEAHVRNALARLGQPAPQATLKRLGVSIEKVRAKILRRARQLGMTALLERYKKASNKKEVASFNCSCIDCGHKITSDKHCINLKCPKCGGQMRRVERPGNGKPEDKKAKAQKEVKKVEEQPKVEESTKVEVKPKTEKAPKTEEKSISEMAKEAVEEATKEKADASKPDTVAKEEVVESKEKLLKAEITKLTSQVTSLGKEIKKIKGEMTKKIDFYKENAVEINKRRDELGDFGKDLTDMDILDKDKFEKAQLEKENVELKTDMVKSSENVAVKGKDGDYYSKVKKEIDNVAFPKNETKKDK